MATAIGATLRGANISRVKYATAIASAFLIGLSAMNFFQSVAPGTVPLVPRWYRGVDVPSKAANINRREYEENIYQALVKRAKPGIDPNTGDYRTDVDIEWGARKIAKLYVSTVYNGLSETIDEGTRVGDSFGTGGHSGWLSNYVFSSSTLNCNEWCTAMAQQFPETELRARGWVVHRVTNSRKYGSPIGAQHNYFVVGFRTPFTGTPYTISAGGESPNVKIGTPQWILDPWIRGRPDIYPVKAHFAIWPADDVDPEFMGAF